MYKFFNRRRERGQNLVELALTLPFLIVVLFAIVEMGRAWQTYQGAKMAAIDGAYTASVFHDETLGENQIQARLEAANIPYDNFNIQPVQNQGGNNITVGYKAQVRVRYVPLFGGMSVPTLGAPIVLIPNEFPIEYNEVYYSSIY